MALAAFEHIKLRLDAVQRVLATLADNPRYVEHVARHASTLRKLLNSAQLLREIKGDDDKALQLTNRISGIGLPADVEADLVGSLHEAMQQGIHRNYRPFQNYTSIHAYLSQRKWEHLMSKTVKKCAKLFELTSFSIVLGLHTYLRS